MGIISTALNMVNADMDRNHQKGFWYEQQEYNTPKNQVERLREAGINPQLAVGNIQSGQGASIAPSHPNVAAGVTDSILQLINNKKQQNIMEAEAREKNSNAFLQEIDGFTRFAKNIQDIKESMSRANKNKADEMATDLLSTSQDMLNRAMVAEIASRNEINWLNYAKGMKELKFLPVQQSLQYVEAMSRIVNIDQSTEESKQRVRKLIQETNHEFFKAQGQDFLNQLNKKTEEFLIRQRKRASHIFNPWQMFDDMQYNAFDIINDW